ncbi:MAG: hypothetical protein H8Z69_03455 [Nanohaloarchaea archaeon]|nr:hypothetical protein [Candidatus Nanohaloarchaea archaeon]
MRRKGISPLIAAVLLIAFTMAVASLFAQWAPQLMKNVQGDTSDRAGDIPGCSTISLSLSNYNESAVTVQQEKGQEPAGNVSVTWQFDGQSPAQEYIQLSDGPTDIEVAYNNASGEVNEGTVTEISATPIECEGAGSSTWTNQSSS